MERLQCRLVAPINHLGLVNWLSGFERLWNKRFDHIDSLITEIRTERGLDQGEK